MSFIIENLRLKELTAVAHQNKSAFDDFVAFLTGEGYGSLHSFVTEANEDKGQEVILKYLSRPLPPEVFLYDGIARPYSPDKAKWLLLGWIFRDAPEQRLRPMIASMPGKTSSEKQSFLLNKLRIYASTIFPEAARWEWISISEVIIDRLEGSRRAIKGTLFEAIVRRHLKTIFETSQTPLQVSESEIKLDGETYDVCVKGRKGQILIPVKTRETMGGGHALLFTRDIHKSISVAHKAGYNCLPIVIAESWAGDFTSLDCKDHIYINKNPNQVKEVEAVLVQELEKRLKTFQAVT